MQHIPHRLARWRAPALTLLLCACGGGNTAGSPSATTQSSAANTPSLQALAASEPAASAAEDSASLPQGEQSRSAKIASGVAAESRPPKTMASFGATVTSASASLASASGMSERDDSSGPVGTTSPTARAYAATATTSTTSGGTAVSVSATTLGTTSATLSTSADNLARVKTAIADMKLPHEIVPAGVGSTIGWKYFPDLGMQTEPYGSAIPSWWPGTRYAQWRGILTWFVIYPDAAGNAATNTAVEINGIELWYLSAKDRSWKLIQSNPLPAWNSAYNQNAIDASPTPAFVASMSTSMSFAPSATNMVHGGLAQVPTPWNAATNLGDIDALLAVVRHRLVLKNPKVADDRSKALLAVEAGVDYYPWVGAKVSDLGAGTYLPGAGLGRFIKSTNGWRYSTFFVRSKRITEAELLSISPPALIY